MATKSTAKNGHSAPARQDGITVEKNVVMLAPSELKDYERNAKKHTDKQITAVAESIKRFGFNVPIIVDAKRVIIAGHCRVAAAKQIGMPMVPCIVKANLGVKEIAAYRLLDNKLNESIWDKALEAEEVKELGLDGQAILMIGYDEAEIRELVGSFGSDGRTDGRRRGPGGSRGSGLRDGRPVRFGKPSSPLRRLNGRNRGRAPHG